MKENEWENILNEEITRIGTTYVTGEEFHEALAALVTRPNSPIIGLEFEVKCEVPFEELHSWCEAQEDRR